MPFRYRLAVDLGSTSLGWSVIRLSPENEPTAIVLSGVRIFSNGRHPKTGTSLAAQRREARSMRRRRDRSLKRKNKLIDALVRYGFFPEDAASRKALEKLDPYRLRAKGLDQALNPYEFGRALFHLNQRRGFQSNRKADKKESDTGVMKGAINSVRQALIHGGFRTIGEWLNQRHQHGQKVRARLNESHAATGNGNTKKTKAYDLYIDRAMVETEFDALWSYQAGLNPNVFHEKAKADLQDILLFQRRLRPVDPGRCTFYPEEKRAPLALPSAQRFRLYQELNNLRWTDDNLQERSLTFAEREAMAQALFSSPKKSFQQLRSLAGLDKDVTFNLEGSRRQDLKGDASSAILSKNQHFGARWATFNDVLQDAIVTQLLTEENESILVAWLQAQTGVDESCAENIANASLPDGYGSLSLKAIHQILPALRNEVITFDKAVIACGFEHHSHLGARSTGEILPFLPYYGTVLQRHVGFGTGNPADPEDRRLGRIANPTVHIGLNQVRVVVNELIQRYGHPSQVVVELARDLKQSWEQKREIERDQAANQARNNAYRAEIAAALGISGERVTRGLIEKRILWNELSPNPETRLCPYSGVQITLTMLLSDHVEIEHILPFARTLDDGLSNKTVAMRQSNRLKGNQTPWEAFGRQDVAGFNYGDILKRVQHMPAPKRSRFRPDGMEKWLKNDEGFLSRALNDTRYLSRVAKEYLECVCPQGTWVVPGRLTAMLRGIYRLNDSDILGWQGQKNRDDHRHHAIDACVIGVTDRRLLQMIATASGQARLKASQRLLMNAPLPWPSYREHVKRAVSQIWVSHKPDHSYEAAMHDDTALGLLLNGYVRKTKVVDGSRTQIIEKLAVIPITDRQAGSRHGFLPDGTPRPYKGYKGNSNYCIEIVRDESSGRWIGEVISTFSAYQVIRERGHKDGLNLLRSRSHGLSGRPLVMRLMINDTIRLEDNGSQLTLRVIGVSSNGQIKFADVHEANVDARSRDKSDPFTYFSKMAGPLFKARARRVTISPSGKLFDPGFKP